MPTVTINYTSNLDSAYQSILDSLDARYHAPGNSFPSFTISDQDLTEISSLSGSHASDGYTQIDDLHVRCPDGSVVHIERLIT